MGRASSSDWFRITSYNVCYTKLLRLWRTRPTAPQASLALAERQRNVRGAFAAAPSVAKLRVAVVDDVMTTGHTVNAAARSLHVAGAKDVQVWVLARA